MPGHSARMVSLNDVTSALTQHSISCWDKAHTQTHSSTLTGPEFLKEAVYFCGEISSLCVCVCVRLKKKTMWKWEPQFPTAPLRNTHSLHRVAVTSRLQVPQRSFLLLPQLWVGLARGQTQHECTFRPMIAFHIKPTASPGSLAGPKTLRWRWKAAIEDLKAFKEGIFLQFVLCSGLSCLTEFHQMVHNSWTHPSSCKVWEKTLVCSLSFHRDDSQSFVLPLFEKQRPCSKDEEERTVGSVFFLIRPAGIQKNYKQRNIRSP